ncbi:CU044_5270 family protein [Streptomyces sp. NPDC127197]|uniref:CU044_5270 family protein n=1 Tax=Streptomyces sp. NPDC127197 TaxID=3345388 RepID=UPI00362E25D9
MKKPYQRARSRDVMTVLANARPAELDPSRLAGTRRQREDLARITFDAPDGASRRILMRPRAWLVPLGAVAVLATSAVVVGVPAQQEPHAGAGASAPSAGTTDPGGRLELLSVAEKVEAAAADEGTYWQVTTRTENVDVVGEPGQRYSVHSTGTSKWSVGVHPGTKSLMVSNLDAKTGPRTAEDKARWRAAGSPRTAKSVNVPGGRKALGYQMGTRQPLVMRTDFDGKIYALGPKNVSYQDLRELPTGHTELRRLLERLYEQAGSAETGAGRTGYVFQQAVNLVTMPVQPAVRAAAYQVIAQLPGIRALGSTTDPLGREGIGFALATKWRTPLGSVEEQIVVNPSTAALLSRQSVLAEPSAESQEAGLKAGTAMNYEATTRMGWAEKQITVPQNARR